MIASYLTFKKPLYVLPGLIIDAMAVKQRGANLIELITLGRLES